MGPWTEKAPAIDGPGQVGRAGLMSRYSALPLCVTGRAEHFFEALTEFPGPDAFFGQGPQPPLGTCSFAPKICSLKPWFRKLLPLGSGEAETGEARGRDGGIREELAEGQF
jgi:hypothetical protein